jgi:hypothetical protein
MSGSEGGCSVRRDDPSEGGGGGGWLETKYWYGDGEEWW